MDTKGSKHPLELGKERGLTFSSNLWKEQCPNKILIVAQYDLIWTI